MFHKIQWRLFANIQNIHALKHDVNIAIGGIVKMPPKNIETIRLYYEIDGELKHLEIGGTITLEDCEDIVSDVDSALSNTEYFKGGEITFKISRKESKRMKKVLRNIMPRYFTNNWRKMYHLPMVRRRGKRK